DRLLISSADGGNSINDAVRIAYYLANIGLTLAQSAPLPAPKDGAQFHFSLPGSRQGFQAASGYPHAPLRVANGQLDGRNTLALHFDALAPGRSALVSTPTFTSRDVLNMRTYDLMATPLVYSGQTVKARIAAPAQNRGAVTVALCCRVYDEHDQLQGVSGDATVLAPGEEKTIEWLLPDFAGQPIGELGLTLEAAGKHAEGSVLVDFIRWDGAPQLTLTRPRGNCDFWRRSWVNGVTFFSKHFPSSFRIAQDRGEGIIIHGTRQWTDYEVETEITLHLGDYGGVAVRAQGLRRYYAARVTRGGQFQIVRTRDDSTQVLAQTPFDLAFERKLDCTVTAHGNRISASIAGVSLEAVDDSDMALRNGGIGLLVFEGALSTDLVRISAA
ncbi:MAG: ADP-ribosylglycohydrolase family protein, partial [Phyllobacterium sp.]